MKEPELVTATQEELDEILLRARPALSDQQYRLLEGVLATNALRDAQAAERAPGDQTRPGLRLPQDQ